MLYALSDADVVEARYTAEELLDTARAFLIEKGFGPMEMSYYSRFDGILTVNYAAVQDGVTLYPDLVKVQVSMRDGTVIGLEAGNYLRNHVERALEAPALTEEEAVRAAGRAAQAAGGAAVRDSGRRGRGALLRDSRDRRNRHVPFVYRRADRRGARADAGDRRRKRNAGDVR